MIDTLAEMKAQLPRDVCAFMEVLLANLADYLDGPAEEASFTDLVGGPVLVIDALEELAAVQPAEEIDGQRVSLLDQSSPWFDIAEWIGEARYGRFATIDNPMGGTQYLISPAIAITCQSVSDSIRLTSERLKP